MARDSSQPTVSQSHERKGVAATRKSKQCAKPAAHRQKLLSVGGGPPAAQKALPIHIIEAITRSTTVRWKFQLQEASGRVLTASDEQWDLNEIDSVEWGNDARTAMLNGVRAKPGTVPCKSSETCLSRRSLIDLEDLSRSSKTEPHGFTDFNKKKKRSREASIPDQSPKRPKASNSDDSDEPFPSDADDPDDVADEADDDFDVEFKHIMIRVDEIGGYFRVMAQMIQQMGCKKILVAWLKVGHPKKQGTYPYNGGGEKNAKIYLDYDKFNPGKHSAPRYWLQQDDWRNPKGADCRHREPDHIKKWERLNLFVHILLLDENEYSDFNFDIETLEEATRDIVKSNPRHFRKGAEEILVQLYKAARQYRSFKRDEIDGETSYGLNLPQKKKAPAAQSANNYPKAEEAKEDWPEEDSDMTYVGQSQPTSPSSLNSGISMSVKSETSNSKVPNCNVHGLTTSQVPSSTYDSLPIVSTVIPDDNQPGLCTLASANNDQHPQYPGNIDMCSNVDHRPDAQTLLHDRNIMSPVPTLGQTTLDTNNGKDIVHARSSKETHTLQGHNHGLPIFNCQYQMHQMKDHNHTSESQWVSPMAAFQPMLEKIEIKPKRNRAAYSSSGSATNPITYPYSAQAMASAAPAPHYGQTTSLNSTSYPASQGPTYNRVIPSEPDYLFNENWYPTPMDAEIVASLSGQTYNTNASSNLFQSQPQFNQPSSSAMTGDYDQTAAANQWSDMRFLQNLID